MSDTAPPPLQMDRIIIRGAIVVSTLAMTAFIGVTFLLLTKEFTPTGKDIALLVFGQVSNIATLVVGYWVGTSVGSTQKNATISQLSGKP